MLTMLLDRLTGLLSPAKPAAQMPSERDRAPLISPITIVLLVLAVLSILMPAIRNARKPRGKRASLADSILADDLVADIEAKHGAIDALPDPMTGVLPVDPNTINAASDAAQPAAAATDTKENDK